MQIQPTMNINSNRMYAMNKTNVNQQTNLSAKQGVTSLPAFADAKSLVNINFKARIHDCAKHGYLEGVLEELSKGESINARDEYGNTALIDRKSTRLNSSH